MTIVMQLRCDTCKSKPRRFFAVWRAQRWLQRHPLGKCDVRQVKR